MNKIKISSLIAVFTALFVGCDKHITGNKDKVVCLKTLEGHSEDILSVAYSPDGTKIVSGSGDKTIKIWDANTGERLKTLKGHSSWVSSVAYSPDGTKIISGSADETVKIWDANTGQCLKIMKGGSEGVNSV
ncbi:MAG: hypothetical protein SPJ75_05155, partial [Candidatus Onthomorpha sp.]|nr:hypothetical protein [Bacteroidales bacterium]MDY5825870.1 hypothetical protein [Candidatus Onthomorpha sp.]